MIRAVATIATGSGTRLAAARCVGFAANAETSGAGLGDNLRFFRNEIPSRPDGDLIEDIHKNWWGDYFRLEHHHHFVQWLFPLREVGVNLQAPPLTRDEALAIRNDPVLVARAIKSLEMMLDFYGMRLVDGERPRVERAPNWLSRLDNLNRSQHNFLRITRILKFLAEVGLERFQRPILSHLADEIKKGHLPNARRSFESFWVPTLRSPPFPRW